MEKPLHVRVAEALGCKPGHPWNPSYDGWRCVCKPVGKEMSWGPHAAHVFHPCHDHEGLGCDNTLARYDLDWAATGPLIERYGFDLDFTPWKGNPKEWTASAWLPTKQEPTENKRVEGDGPLSAVCNLILALKAAGKLAGPS